LPENSEVRIKIKKSFSRLLDEVGVDGMVIVEIPDSEVVASGEVEIYLLPSDLDYTLEITGTGNGKMDLDVITPQGDSEAKVVSFQNVALRPGDRLSSELKSGGKMSSLRSGGTALSPAWWAPWTLERRKEWGMGMRRQPLPGRALVQ